MQTLEIKQKVTPALRKYGIKHAAVFGSVSRGENHPGSDIDVLIELGKPMGLLAYTRLVKELETALGQKVDLVTENSINKFIKPHIITDLKTIYEG
ncbi:MAG TPA: nucleotidyltransferase family protein [Candidatus Paceibacterota bacterium]